MKPTKEVMPVEEAPEKETPAEMIETEEGIQESKPGVKISEAFQSKCHEMCSILTKEECRYLRDMVSDRESELMYEKNKEVSELEEPASFSAEEMPKS